MRYLRRWDDVSVRRLRHYSGCQDQGIVGVRLAVIRMSGVQPTGLSDNRSVECHRVQAGIPLVHGAGIAAKSFARSDGPLGSRTLSTRIIVVLAQNIFDCFSFAQNIFYEWWRVLLDYHHILGIYSFHVLKILWSANACCHHSVY